jgi:nicotinamide riboside transporter PnuC
MAPAIPLAVAAAPYVITGIFAASAAMQGYSLWQDETRKKAAEKKDKEAEKKAADAQKMANWMSIISIIVGIISVILFAYMIWRK